MGISLENLMEGLTDDRRKEIEAKGKGLVNEELTRRALRKARGETQASIAAKLGIKQENVSRIEQRADIMLSTLNDYLASMGGKLTLIAEFEGREPVRLVGFGDTDHSVPKKSRAALPTGGAQV